MSTTKTAGKTGRITIASVVLPLRPNGGRPPGDVRLLVCEEDRTKYTILAGRLEFATGLVSGAVHEKRLLGGDIVLSFRDGYLEEALVNRVSPAVKALILDPTGVASPLAVEALQCIRRCWHRVATMPAVAAALNTREARCVRAVAPNQRSSDPDEAWTVLEDQIQVSWITV